MSLLRHSRSPFILGAALAILLIPAACGTETEAVVSNQIPCRVAQRLVPLPASVTEASGVAVSTLQTGVFWSHNDSGGEATLYAADPVGQLLGSLTVTGADNLDWEDLAIGPCEGGNCAYVADIGDNDDEREDVFVYRFPEPLPGVQNSAQVTRFILEYPDGPRDAEAFFVLPPDRMFIVTKGTDHPVSIYRVPEDARPERVAILEHIRDLSGGRVPLEDRVTGAAASRSGDRVGIRTRTSLLLYDAEALVGGEPIVPSNISLATLGEPQGEGVAFGPNGTIVVTSEGGVDGAPGMLGVLWCPED